MTVVILVQANQHFKCLSMGEVDVDQEPLTLGNKHLRCGQHVMKGKEVKQCGHRMASAKEWV